MRDKDFVVGRFTVANDYRSLQFERTHFAFALNRDPAARAAVLESAFRTWLNGKFSSGE